MDSAGLGEPDMAWPGDQGPSLFLRGPSAPGAPSSPPGCLSLSWAGEGGGNFLGNKLHSVDFAAELFAFPRGRPSPGTPTLFLPLFGSPHLVLSNCDGVRLTPTGRGWPRL